MSKVMEISCIFCIMVFLVFNLKGAGQGAKVFQLFKQELFKLESNCRIVSFDCRCHGMSNDGDLSLAALVIDLKMVIEAVKGNSKQIFLVGHSLGGAVIIEYCNSNPGIIRGAVVIDVVEGSAIESLSKMNIILNSRPKYFLSINDAITWCINTGQSKNRSSLQISIPSQLCFKDDRYYWRTDLESSSAYWYEWFTKLSNKFLSCKTAKLLILAGTDRLDKELIIGQMQGKFQLEIIADCG